MKKLFALLMVGAALLTACSSDSGYTTQSASEFQATASDPSVVVLDVRTPGEFVAGHLPNAINIDVEAGNFAEEIKNLDTSKTYAVYCRSGRRSALAAEQMVSAGFTSVFNLDSGLLNWNGPLVTGP